MKAVQELGSHKEVGTLFQAEQRCVAVTRETY